MSNFNWKTDDDVVWDEESAMGEETAVSPRRPWLTILFIIATIAVAGMLIYRQVDKRVETATADIEGDILSTHNLALQASLENDADLFITLLSGRSKVWSSLQVEAVEEGWLYERTALDLHWLPPKNPKLATISDLESSSAGIALEIDPELRTAELTFDQIYAVAVGNGVTETVVLQQTAVYRRGSVRWLLSPPDTEFWGEYTMNQGDMLTMAYPARDAAIAEKLGFDLDAKLNEMCRTLPDLNCPDDLRVHLRLSNDLNSLVWASDPLAVLDAGLQMDLPTPTLVGLPVDEAGYQALYRGYAVKMLTAVIPQLVDYDCCQHAIFFQTLTDYQLSQLGLRSWSVTTDDYANVISRGVSGSELSQVWQRSRPEYLVGLDGWKVYTVVDYLIQRFPETAVAEMQRLIPDSGDFRNWLERVRGPISTLTESPNYMQTFDREWRQYAFQQTLADQEPPPIPWPEQDIYLSCLDFEANLHRLNLTDMSWTALLSGSPNNFVNPLPDKDGLVIQNFGFGEDEQPTTTIWLPDGEPLVMEHGHISVGQFAPDGRLMAYGFEGNAPVLIDVADCPDDSCRLFPLAGLPVWSPDGSDFILLPEEALPQNHFAVNGRSYLFNQELPLPEWPLHRGGTTPVTSDIDEMTYIGPGYSPFWLDETTYGYIRQVPLSSNSSDHELVLTSKADDQPRVLLTEDDLMAAAPDRPSRFDLDIGIVLRHPTYPDLLFILAFYHSEMVYLFSYDVDEAALNFHFRTEMNYFHSLGTSPNGRFLALAGTELETGPNPINQILLYDIVHEQFKQFRANTESFFAPANIYDWSSDSQWLVIILDDLSFLLVAPEYDYQRIIPHDLGYCTNIIWLNK